MHLAKIISFFPLNIRRAAYTVSPRNFNVHSGSPHPVASATANTYLPTCPSKSYFLPKYMLCICLNPATSVNEHLVLNHSSSSMELYAQYRGRCFHNATLAAPHSRSKSHYARLTNGDAAIGRVSNQQPCGTQNLRGIVIPLPCLFRPLLGEAQDMWRMLLCALHGKREANERLQTIYNYSPLSLQNQPRPIGKRAHHNPKYILFLLAAT